jgi:hypothetical protein
MNQAVTRLPRFSPRQSSNPVELAIEALRLCERIRGLDDPLLTTLFELACQGIMESLTENQRAEAFSRTRSAGIGPHT